MNELPQSIAFATVRDFLESLGIDANCTRSVHFDIDEVIVEQTRMDPLGHPTFGTVTTTIPYVRDDR